MEKQFTTTDGRVYTIEISMGVVRRTEAMLGKRLTAIFVTPELREKYLNDDLGFSDVLYAIIKPQADANGLSKEQFEDTLTGDTFRAAYAMVLENLAYFFEEPLRGLILNHLAKAREMTARIKAELQNVVDDANQKFDQIANSLPTIPTPTKSDSSLQESAA
jgi:hypothetical protein